MEAFCPQCHGVLDVLDEQTASCASHGEFRILFWRDQIELQGRVLAPAPVAQQAPPSLAGAPDNAAAALEAGAAPPVVRFCGQHPGVQTQTTCALCRAPICNTCTFTLAGTAICPECASQPAKVQELKRMRMRTVVGSAPARLSAQDHLIGVNCALHPQVPAIRRCGNCRNGICATCDFSYPSGIHLCPKCAANPQQALGSKRKAMLIGAYALAAWATLGLALLFGGAFANSRATREELGVMVSVLIMIPAIVGTALGVGCLDRRLSNPAVVWVAAIWNGIILTVLVLLSVIGAMQR